MSLDKTRFLPYSIHRARFSDTVRTRKGFLINTCRLPRSRSLPFFGWIRQNPVLSAALAAALITACFVPPDAAYLSYFDWKTLTCLFSTLAVVCALRNIHFFTILARRIVERFSNLRSASLALVCITFIGSMFIANDMALLTFLPLGYFVLSITDKRRYMAYVFILQNIAANLGGMLTPFGNPQNLFLYTKFSIPNLEFLRIMFPPFALSVAMIAVCCLLLPRDALTIDAAHETLPRGRTAVYLALFALTIVMVFRLLPYTVGGLIVLAALLFLDRDALRKVDYPLLFTFAAFFVFAGNMGRISAVRALFTSIPARFELAASVLSCQIISNVPTAVLLSQFTSRYPSLLVGVNIGGTGTLIASLASLITFREYNHRCPGQTGAYVRLFSILNFSFLAVLLAFSTLLGY
ncbi:MAG: SLC13 family permease [Eubacteriales bacterium]|nr:SLC13 family permease [Eubacteriales bacterium]